MTNIPSKDYIEHLHRKYAPNQHVYDLVYSHCKIVAEIASWCSANAGTEVDKKLLESAALLHDIGSYVFFDDKGEDLNRRLYPQHAILGAKILADEGIDEAITKIVESHILLGLSKQEIIDFPWPLPERNYEPQTVEGELLCYADRFHSKQPTFNDFGTFLKRLMPGLPLQAEKFELWSKRFGIPDIAALSKKYSQPLR